MKRLILPVLFAVIIALFACSCELVGQAENTKEPEPQATAEASGSAESAPDEEPLPSAEPTNEPSEEPSEEPVTEPSDEPVSESEPSQEVNSTEETPAQSAVDTTEPAESSEPDAPPVSEAPATPDASQYNPTISAEATGSAVLKETSDYGQEYIDKMVFLGDSTTYGMKYYAVLKDGKNTNQVWTPSNGTLTLSYQSFASIVYPDEGTEITIREALEKKQPEYFVITLGVNGVSFMDEDYFKSEYSSLVADAQSICPNTKIILQSIFPVATNYEYLKSINNNNITAANGWIQSIAEAYGVRYLDTASVLRGDDGWLKQEYQNGDGLHLNETGFKQVLNYIRTHGYQ